MCGICGVFPQTEISSMFLPFMVWDIEKRGGDSWGAMCKDGILVKNLGKITDTMKTFPDCESVVYHTRQASQGAVTIENSHPFEFKHEGKRIIGVHNGVISNHTALNTNNNRNFNVDSMHIFAHMAEGKPLSDIYGWGAIVWYENGELRFAKVSESAALSMIHLESGEYVFTSELDTLIRAKRLLGVVAKVVELEAGVMYRLVMKDNVPSAFSIGKLGMERVTTFGRTHHYTNGQEDFDTTYANACKHCHQVKIDPNKQLVCAECFVKLKAILRPISAEMGHIKV